MELANDYFIPKSFENSFFLCQDIVFTIATILNLLALFFLVREMPPHQSSIRIYLITLQVLLLVNDVYIDVFYKPVPLFPLAAGIGILCMFHVAQMTYLVILFCWILAQIGVVIIICTVFRHQQVLPHGHPLKLEKITLGLVRAALLVLFTAPEIIMGLILRMEGASIDEALEKLNISWITERGSLFVVFEKAMEIKIASCSLILVLTIAFVLILCLFSHMFFELNRDRSYSPTTLRNIRRSLQVLFVQLIIPLSLIVAPLIIVLTGITFDCVGQKVSLASCALLLVHSIVHNIILLFLTPTYRRALSSLFQCFSQSSNLVQPSELRFERAISFVFRGKHAM